MLYAISQTFAELAVDIAGARIVTERGAAIDSFYVRELDGGKIISPERQKLIEDKLREAIKRFDTARLRRRKPVASRRRLIETLRFTSGGCGSMVECGLPKAETRVRFPSPAPILISLNEINCYCDF